MPTATMLMELLEQRILEQAQRAADIQVSYRFVLSGNDGGSWLVNLKEPVGVLKEPGADQHADCTIRLSASDFVALLQGSANARQLFFEGKLEIEGDMEHAAQLERLAELVQ